MCRSIPKRQDAPAPEVVPSSLGELGRAEQVLRQHPEFDTPEFREGVIIRARREAPKPLPCARGGLCGCSRVVRVIPREFQGV